MSPDSKPLSPVAVRLGLKTWVQLSLLSKEAGLLWFALAIEEVEEAREEFDAADEPDWLLESFWSTMAIVWQMEV